jgi:glycogen operon protein
MFRAGDEFLQTQWGAGNVYNIDTEQSWLDWNRLNTHEEVVRFFQKMIAFRKHHPSLGRSLFWRNEIHWYGVGNELDLSYESRSFAYCLRGRSENDDDVYVMINTHWQAVDFVIQEGQPGDWKRIVDTSINTPNDFVNACEAPSLLSLTYTLQPRSIAVLAGTLGVRYGL